LDASVSFPVLIENLFWDASFFSPGVVIVCENCFFGVGLDAIIFFPALIENLFLDASIFVLDASIFFPALDWMRVIFLGVG